MMREASVAAHALHVANELLQAGADDFDGHAGGFVSLDLLQLFLRIKVPGVWASHYGQMH
jgi:hypothetical protein